MFVCTIFCHCHIVNIYSVWHIPFSHVPSVPFVKLHSSVTIQISITPSLSVHIIPHSQKTKSTTALHKWILINKYYHFSSHRAPTVTTGLIITVPQGTYRYLGYNHWANCHQEICNDDWPRDTYCIPDQPKPPSLGTSVTATTPGHRTPIVSWTSRYFLLLTTWRENLQESNQPQVTYGIPVRLFFYYYTSLPKLQSPTDYHWSTAVARVTNIKENITSSTTGHLR